VSTDSTVAVKVATALSSPISPPFGRVPRDEVWITFRPCGVVVSVTTSTGVMLDEEQALIASVRVRADKYLFILLPVKKRHLGWRTAVRRAAGDTAGM
jgi:hypothetical protein